MKYKHSLSFSNDIKISTDKSTYIENKKLKFNSDKKNKEYADGIKQKTINISFIKRIYIFILIFLIFPILSNELMLIYYRFSYITLTIDGIGEKSVFYEKDENSGCTNFVPPDEVYINII